MPATFDEYWLATLPQRGGSRGLQDGGAAPLPADTPEQRLLAQVIRLATSVGFLAYHTHDSRRSPEGFPDLVLAKPGRLLCVELKSAAGKLTQAQHQWLDILAHSLPGLEVYCWRPADWPLIQQLLQHRPTQEETPHG